MWWQLAVAGIGLWLMAAPAALTLDRPAATIAWILGPVIASFATVAAWGATRSVRWVNVALGVWLVIAPVLMHHNAEAATNSIVCGLAAAGLSAPRGRINHRFGGGWSSAWRGSAGPRSAEEAGGHHEVQ